MSIRKTMNVSITAELERSVAARVAAGRYRMASKVVCAALSLLDKEEPVDGGGPAQCAPRREWSGDHVGPTS